MTGQAADNQHCEVRGRDLEDRQSHPGQGPAIGPDQPGGANQVGVEDEPDIRDVLLAYLRRDGHDVQGTGDGAYAWTLFGAAGFELAWTSIASPRCSPT